MGVFDIVMEISRFFHYYIIHTHRFDGLQQVFLWLYQTHPSLRRTSAGFSMTISNTPIDLTDFSRFFNDYIKYTHLFDWLQQVFPWLYQTHPSPRLTSPGFSMTISNTPIVLTDFRRFFHDYIKITIASTDFSWFSHDYVKNTTLQLTSAGFSMTMSSTHLFNWLQQVFLWLCQAHTSSTDFSRFFHHYIKHTLRFDWLQQVFSWLYQTHPSPRLTSEGFPISQLKSCVLDIVMGKPAEVSRSDSYV
jgi:hypothetical protein